MDNSPYHVPELGDGDNEVSLHVVETFAENLIKYKLNLLRTECFSTVIRVLSTRLYNPSLQTRSTINLLVKCDQTFVNTFLQ